MKNKRLVQFLIFLFITQYAFSNKRIKLYEGPSLSENQIATLYEGDFQIVQIDKRPFLYIEIEGLFELLPGEHVIYFKGKSQQSNNYILTTTIANDKGILSITANFKEGLHYEITFHKLSNNPDKFGTYPILPAIKNNKTNEIFFPNHDLKLLIEKTPNDKLLNSNMSDSSEFSKIPKTNEYAHSRWEAIRNPSFSNQVELGMVAKTDPNEEVRKEAVNKISDQVALTEIAKTDQSAMVCWAAVVNRNLKDQILFSDLAKNAKDEHVRRYVVNKLTNKELLAEIIKADKNKLVREAAKEKLNELNNK